MRYVIIGNGVAGTTAAAEIRKRDGQGSITIITEEPHPFYSRIRLWEFLCNDVDEQGLVIRKEAWYRENRIDLLLGTRVTAVDPATKKITTEPGTQLDYDLLLLATGGRSFIPPIPGAEKKGVFTLKTIEDARAIREFEKNSGHRVLLIGGGVLGLEAGNALRKTGCSITVVEIFPRLLPRQMDPAGAGVLQAQMEEMGFQFYLGVKSKEIVGKDAVEGLILEDGRRIDADLIIISAGIRPNLDLPRKIGIETDKGVLVNDRMETSLPGIYAAGDAAQHKGSCYGIWPAAQEQGGIAGINMTGGNVRYEGTTMSNLLKVVGIDLFAAGDIDAEGKKESFVFQDREKYVYKKLVIENNVIIGTILLGDIRDRKKIVTAMENRKNVGNIRKELEKWNLERL